MKILHLTLPHSDQYGYGFATQLTQLLNSTGFTSLINEKNAENPPMLFAGLRLSGYLRRNEIDVVIIHSSRWLEPAVTAVRLSGRECLTVFMPSCNAKQIARDNQTMEALKMVDAIILPSPAACEKFKKNFEEQSIDDKRIFVLAPSFDMLLEHRKPSNLYLMSSPLSSDYQIKEMIETIAAESTADKKNDIYVISGIGKGNYVMPMIRRCRTKKVNIEWIGAPLYHPEIMAHAAAFVTCYGDNEPMFDICKYAAEQNEIEIINGREDLGELKIKKECQTQTDATSIKTKRQTEQRSKTYAESLIKILETELRDIK